MTIKTLTPLWTGGVDQSSDRLHETGLIGSLRWWYEALVRGLGGEACDPTERGCIFDEYKYRNSTAKGRRRFLDAGVCDACQLFGCTGWARRFRLIISDGQSFFGGRNVLIPSERKHGSKKDPQAGGWFVFSESRIGEIRLTPTLLQKDVDLSPIGTVLALISRHGSIGAKCSSGYGVIDVKNFSPNLQWLKNLPVQETKRGNNSPDFRDFFFARFQFEAPGDDGGTPWWESIDGIKQAYAGKLDDGTCPRPLRPSMPELKKMVAQGIIPLAPAIRNRLRYKWKHYLSPAETNFVFGKAQVNASKIMVSYAYSSEPRQWEFRIWGWLPCEGILTKRDNYLDSLKKELNNRDFWVTIFGRSDPIPKMVEWHALDCSQTNGRAYLKKLLGGAL
ncbi:MAG TPA: type III-B CRISPR module RAMP protein Cmr1 [Firmicutes bacterium]|nr:type III-B CRISPR module RAMP protein Cmr1 [Bacillota bacterium]